jgi:hypothetical protein
MLLIFVDSRIGYVTLGMRDILDGTILHGCARAILGTIAFAIRSTGFLHGLVLWPSILLWNVVYGRLL